MTKLSDLSKEQMLMYAGAAGTAACALTAVGSSTVMEKHIYTKTAPAVPGGIGKRLMNWHVVESLSLSALQAVSAQEKPSKKMLGATGAAWLGAAAVMGTHTFHHKSTDQNIGTALTVGSVAIGGAMIARAIQMHRNE